ncbi:FMN-linked oxidoreductase [Infundibulicybe gibba]|nr:FMN-linked oxidoreductase [Infundibulicybe gibba]
MSQPKLFQPIQVGRLALQHRVVLAPLTRVKSGRTDHIPTIPLMKEYYSQRASAPGTLLITEATFIAAQAGGYPNIPGIWSQVQIDAWKQITDAVHDKGSYIFLQLWALGRAASPDTLAAEDPSFPHISASNIKLADRPASEPAPRALTLPEIDEYVALYAQAARNAIEAGFDGVEIHGANGYLIDQFLQDVSNVRDDEYGGSVENRSRFALRVVDAVVDAVGADRTGIRLSPWSPFQDMGMPDPLPQFTHLISTLARTHTDLAYIHLVEPPVSANADRTPAPHESNTAFRAIWAPRRVISAGGYDRASALAAAEEDDVLVAFGRKYISNPDLPQRLQKDIPLTPYVRETFYTPADKPDAAHGYTDYPFAEEGVRL